MHKLSNKLRSFLLNLEKKKERNPPKSHAIHTSNKFKYFGKGHLGAAVSENSAGLRRKYIALRSQQEEQKKFVKENRPEDENGWDDQYKYFSKTRCYDNSIGEELVRFDGYWIKKSAVARLKKIKGLSNSNFLFLGIRKQSESMLLFIKFYGICSILKIAMQIQIVRICS